jgi:hypothetical protein
VTVIRLLLLYHKNHAASAALLIYMPSGGICLVLLSVKITLLCAALWIYTPSSFPYPGLLSVKITLLCAALWIYTPSSFISFCAPYEYEYTNPFVIHTDDK